MVGEWGREDESDSDSDSEEPWASAFVSVSTSLETGGSYGNWVYWIHATPNMIDPTVANEGEPEIFALGGVHWSQVVGWQRTNIEGQEQLTDAGFTPNPDYRGDRYDRLALTNVDPRSGWRYHDRRYWTQLMNRQDVGSAVGFTGQFPLQFETYQPNDNIPGPAPDTQGDRPPTSPPAGAQGPALNVEDIMMAAEYVQEHNAPCDLSGLNPRTQVLTLETDANIARSLARLHQDRPNQTQGTIEEADQAIQAIIARLREADERATCNLAAACSSSYQFSQRKRATGKAPRAGSKPDSHAVTSANSSSSRHGEIGSFLQESPRPEQNN